MRVQLDSLGLNYKFFPAIDGRAEEHLQFTNYRDEFCLEAWRRPLTPGEIGCFASHYLLWQRCVERNEPMIVMEDDVDISPRFVEAIKLLPGLDYLGYLRLSGINFPRNKIALTKLPAEWEIVRFLERPMGTQCYALFPGSADKFIKNSARWTLPVDNYMDSFWLHNIPCIGLAPFQVSIPRTIASTISSDGVSPSTQMRTRVWRPKRFLARGVSNFRHGWGNLEYALGLRKLQVLTDVQP